MAVELKDALAIEASLKEGSNGVFEIVVDGKLIFSKKATHRFPEKGEVARLIRGA